MIITVEKAISLLKSGEIVAIPTETVYGLAALATDESAVQKIFTAKNRPANNPLICHFASIDQILEFTVLRPELMALTEFWPGPLTLLLPLKDKFSKLSKTVTAGSERLGVRIPNHELTLSILKQAYPLAAPSANISGRTSSVTAANVEQQLADRISGVVDGGKSSTGLESTVLLPIKDKELKILRPGMITSEMLIEKGFKIAPDSNLEFTLSSDDKVGLLSPGLLPVHYRPKVPLILLKRVPGKIQQTVNRYAKENSSKRICLLWYEDFELNSTELTVIRLSSAKSNLQARYLELASNLYASLLEYEKDFEELVIIEPEDQATGVAINDRLKRAASRYIESL